MASSAAAVLRKRGVHWADYLLRGRPVLLAIDSRGELVKRVRLERDEDEGIARVWLEGLIEHYDPLPRTPLLRIIPREPVNHPSRFYIPRHAKR